MNAKTPTTKTNFGTLLLGDLAVQVIWVRAFCAKDLLLYLPAFRRAPSSARKLEVRARESLAINGDRNLVSAGMVHACGEVTDVQGA